MSTNSELTSSGTTPFRSHKSTSSIRLFSWCAGLCLCAVAGIYPVLVLMVAVAVVCAFALSRSAYFRLVWLIAGALLVFQTDAGLSTAKLAYVGGLIVSSVFSVRGVVEVLRSDWGRRFRPAVLATAVIVVWVGLISSLYAIIVAGASVQDWLRDSLTYLLISVAVLVGVDATRHVSLRVARRTTVILGLASAYGFSTAWISRRHIDTSTVDSASQSLLASIAALAVPFALALVMGLTGRIRTVWLLYGTVLVLAVLVTGTRTGLVLGAVLLGVTGLARHQRVSFGRALVGLSVLFALLGVALPVASTLFTTSGYGQSRLRMAILAITQGIGQDASGAERLNAYALAKRIFLEHPLMGQGVGVSFPSARTGRVGTILFSLDTPWTLLAKFGIAGGVIIISSIGLIVFSCARRDGGEWLIESTVARGTVVFWIALLPFGVISEDKGFAISVALLILLVGTASKEASRPKELHDPQLDAESVIGALPSDDLHRWTASA